MPILLNSNLLEEVLRAGRWHLRTAVSPFSSDKDLTLDVCLLLELLFIFLLLLCSSARRLLFL